MREALLAGADERLTEPDERLTEELERLTEALDELGALLRLTEELREELPPLWPPPRDCALIGIAARAIAMAAMIVIEFKRFMVV